MLELVYNGKVHYRRPDSHPDIKEWREVVKRNPLYSIRGYYPDVNCVDCERGISCPDWDQDNRCSAGIQRSEEQVNKNKS